MSTKFVSISALVLLLSSACSERRPTTEGPCATDGGCATADAAMPCDDGLVWNGEACVDDPTCVPECGASVCGPDGCGGECGVCELGQSCEAGACVAGPDDCPANSHSDGEGCVCDTGFITFAACGRCVPDAGGGCPANAYSTADGCACLAGYAPAADGCGCEPDGSVGAPCTSDAECAGECLSSLRDFDHSPYDTTFSGGYCSLPACGYCADAECTTTYCESWGGTCVEVFTEYPSNGDRMHACLVACADDQECRSGYVCRRLQEEDPANVDPDQTFCLPSL